MATTKITPAERKAKTAKLREKHQAIFNSLGTPTAKFFPKCAYFPSSGAEKVIALFPSEIKGGEDIYTEFVNRDQDPEDPSNQTNPERKLWRWNYDPDFDTKYTKTEPDALSGSYRYLVPVSELLEIKFTEGTMDPGRKDKTSESFKLSDPETDLPFDQLTIRDYASIHLGVPASEKGWLNDIITKARK